MKHTINSSVFGGLALLATASFAGRPLSVDDASINEQGQGHVEAYFQKAGSDKAITIAPAFAITKSLEISAAYQRETTTKTNVVGLGAKYLITEPQKSGCNYAASAAYARVSGAGAIGLTGISTCALGFANLNLNVGLNHSTGSNVKTWGVALEKDMGSYTPHVEYFGAQGSSPTFQVGARTSFGKWQLDGTVGRSSGNTVFSIGTKYSF